MEFIDKFFKYKTDVKVMGLTKELDVLYIVNYFKTHDEDVIVLTSSLFEANNFFKLIQAYTDYVLFFPMDDFLTSVAVAISPDLKLTRLDTLESLKKRSRSKYIIVTSLMGYLKFLPHKDEEQDLVLNLSPSNISREIIIERLEGLGYRRDSLVTTTGEYAVRGYIIDLFPIHREKPVRIEFFDEDIECIKEFDENSQRTIRDLECVEIKRFNETTGELQSSLIDYLYIPSIFLIDESQINVAYKNLQQEMYEYKEHKGISQDHKYMFDYSDITLNKTFLIETINTYDDDKSLVYSSKELVNFNSNLDELKSFCQKEKKTIVFILQNRKQKNIISDLFDKVFITDTNHIEKDAINIIFGSLNSGFIFENYVVISPNDIDKKIKKDIRYKNTIKIGRKVKTFTDLADGDYIVHETHGIGIYKGLKTLKKGQYTKDYIELEYAGNDKVYVPVENIDKLYKYTSNLGTHPKLNKLNSTAWAKKKSETRKRIKDISEELLELYSNRSKITTVAYKDYEEEIKFGLDFPFNLTKDQEKTIQEIDYDLKSAIPMDRLLCGDVGYGKTEVAFRAMFKTVINNFQVSYLCPTTILSKQQYTSAIERFKDFPIRIELLNRHVPQKKVTNILKDLEEGKIDIIIGTHKLLNEKIKYKKLGLLVIDEEQRFGVSHKEKIKKIKSDINVLTLSATPIPRTLKMAMSGLRSLSVLDTPPINRYPIQTYVIEENDLIIRDAIYKELTRKGQIFILINNIDALETFKDRLSKLIPEASIVTAHGQMDSEQINTIMEKFINCEYDILICTTIIETGIDIPNVNTIIILDSDRFGLSQLYQIRGRVGRSDKIAYAYLMYNPAKILTETAIKRLESIKEFTELGSGYKIAMRDLAIRGAGDLLGSEQAGFIDAVGLDLYTKMINEEVSRLEGKTVDNEDDMNKHLNVNSYIDDKYVEDENIKIEIHKLINSIKNQVDFQKVKNELEDRFGKIDEALEEYMKKCCVESILKELKIANIIELQNRITIVLNSDISNQIDGEKLFLQSYSIHPKFEISYKNREIRISLNTLNLQKGYVHYFYELLLLIKEQIKEV